MSLAKLIVPSKTVWDEYPGLTGFEVELAYLTKDELLKLRSKATTSKFSKKTRQPEDEIDSDLFQSLYIKAVIKNWRGLKYKFLPKLVPVDLSGVTDLEAELAFTSDDAEMLMRNAPSFDNWVSSVIEDVENFTQASSTVSKKP